MIVDDEPAAHYVLANYISKHAELELVHNAYNGIEALEYLENNTVDLMFLDIDMPEVTGLDLLKKLHNPPITILTTAYSEFGAESYEYRILDYLLKPIFYPRFVKSIQKLIESQPAAMPAVLEQHSKIVKVKVDSDFVDIEVSQILYIQSYGNYVNIFTSRRSYLATATTTEIEKALPASLFMRAHKSYIVALEKIDELNRDNVVIKNVEIPIGITYRRELIDKIKHMGAKGISIKL